MTKTHFDGESLTPFYQARRYIYRCLYRTLEADLDNGSEYLVDNLRDENDRLAAFNAALKVIRELRKKAEGR